MKEKKQVWQKLEEVTSSLKDSFFMNNKITVAVLGSTGYVGLELIYLLSKHPNVTVKFLGSKSFANQDINASEEIWNFVSKFDINGLIDCNTTSNNEINIIQNKKLLSITDMLGRNIKELKNIPLFYLYDDGSVEKKIIIE
mgnify:CR=1 FL=1